MLLLVGLGNPGAEYAGNRHNIGFMAVDEIVRRHSFAPFKSKFSGQISEGRLGLEKVLLLKPMTFMNDSGRSVAAAASFYKIPAHDIIVLHDELDLEAGRLRCKTGGGHAGHNGLRSIHDHLGDGYRRLRLGIGHPGDRNRVTSYVLKDFARADQAWLVPLLQAIADHMDLMVDGNEAEFMNRIIRHTRSQEE